MIVCKMTNHNKPLNLDKFDLFCRKIKTERQKSRVLLKTQTTAEEIEQDAAEEAHEKEEFLMHHLLIALESAITEDGTFSYSLMTDFIFYLAFQRPIYFFCDKIIT